MKKLNVEQLAKQAARDKKRRIERARVAKEVAEKNEKRNREYDEKQARLEESQLLEACQVSAANIIAELVKMLPTAQAANAAEPEHVVIKEEPQLGELFGVEKIVPLEMDSNWAGWKEFDTETKYPYYKDFGYFKHVIANRLVDSVDDLYEHAKLIVKIAGWLQYQASDGASLESCLTSKFGSCGEEFIAEYGEQLFRYMERMHKVGFAKSGQDTFAALKKKALGGNLDAQKTMLRHVGELAAEKTGKVGSGTLSLYFDSDDAEL